jgi:hypothetical protein
MTQPDPQTNDEALRAEILNNVLIHEPECDYSIYEAPCDCVQQKVADNLMQLHTKDKEAAVLAALDRIADSVKQHTVPEGRDLVTRSYVLNTIEFERSRSSLQTGGKS